jgi:hypothetical protein
MSSTNRKKSTMPADHPDFRAGRQVPIADVNRLLNAPIQSSPYVEAYLENDGMEKIDDGQGGTVRINPACCATNSWTCNYCGKNLIKLPKCAACGVVGYCDRACQKAGWKEHKPICLEMRKNNKEAGPEAELAAQSSTSSEKLMKWLTMVPGFVGNIRELAMKSPFQGDHVPLFFIQGGSNPFVACVNELTGKEREFLLNMKPEARHHMRPLSQFERERNMAMGTRTVAYTICRPPDACMIRGRV